MANVYDWPSFLLRIGTIFGIGLLSWDIMHRAVYIQDPAEAAKMVFSATPIEMLFVPAQIAFFSIMLLLDAATLPLSLTGNRKIAVGFMIGSIVMLFAGLTLSILAKNGNPIFTPVRFPLSPLTILPF